MKLNILHITPDFRYACGRSYYVFLLLKYLKQNNHNVFLITNGGDSFDRLQDYDIPYLEAKSLMSKNPVSYARAISLLRDFVIKKNIDIIHTHHRYCELLAVQVSKIIRKKKVRTVFTSLSLVKRKYKIEYRSDKIIAVSNSIYRMLTERFGIDKNKIEIIPNFTDTEELNELETGSDSPVDDDSYFDILAIGRFHKDKNFGILLKAIDLLKDYSIRLILIGEGDRFIEYKSFIHKHRLLVKIVVPQKKLTKYFLAADICVLPSVRDPFPNFMLQSGLHKKPFIGTRVDGIAELIRDRVNGLLFESGNAKELAQKIKLFKEDKILAMDCSENLYIDVINNYTQEFALPKIEKLYRQVLK